MQFYSKMEHRPTGGANVAVNHTANQIICQIIVLKKIPQKAQTQQTLHEVAEMTPESPFDLPVNATSAIANYNARPNKMKQVIKRKSTQVHLL